VNNIKHVFWDWNGTLVNDAWLFVEIMNVELKKRNLKLIDESEYRRSFRFPVKKYYENLGFNFHLEDFEKVGDDFIKKFSERCLEPSLYSDSLEMIEYFFKNGISQSILSAQENNLLNETVKHYNINHYFKSVAGINDIYARSKIKLAITERSKIEHNDNEILIVGDTSHDFEVSKHLNVNCILFSRGHYSRERLILNKCKVVENLSEIKSIINVNN